MKTTLVILSYLIFAFIARPLPVLGDASPAPVLDIVGKQLRAGTNYYVLPVIRGRGGGLTLASRVWRLDNFDEVAGQWFVTSGGVEGNPSRETTSNWFKIEKFGDDYKLVFCPSVCDFCKVLCRFVGIFVDGGGGRRLALSDFPFKVMFKKV